MTTTAAESTKTSRASAAPLKDTDCRWTVLAGLRFFFAFIVVAEHTFQMAHLPGWLKLIRLCDAIAAVVGFLLVSGYSIAHSITENPQGYYLRRLRRIYPLYLAGLLLAVVPLYLCRPPESTVVYTAVHGSLSPWPYLGTALFLQGFIVKTVLTNNVLWTLSLEVFFYIIAPWLVRLSSRVIAAMIACSAAAYLTGIEWHHVPWIQLWGGNVLFYGWAWLLGFLYYRLQSDRRMIAAIILLPGCLIAFYNVLPHKLDGYTLLVGMTLLVLGPFVKIGSSGVKKSLNYLGEISYPLYVVHWPLLLILADRFPNRSGAYFVAFVVIAAAVAYHLVDVPFRRKFRRA